MGDGTIGGDDLHEHQNRIAWRQIYKDDVWKILVGFDLESNVLGAEPVNDIETPRST